MRGCDLPKEREETAATAIADLAFIARSTNRIGLLDALRRRPYERRELREELSMSAPTFARILVEFEDRGWVERDGKGYRATTTGALLAGEVVAVVEAIETVHRLQPLCRTLPIDVASVNLEALSDARVSVAEPGTPLAPVRRFLTLVERTETLFDVNATPLYHFDAHLFDERLADGRATELVYEHRAVESLRTERPESFEALCENRAASLFARDAVPLGVSLFDDRVGLCGYDPTTGGLAVFVDTDDPDARRWAETLYEGYRDGSVAIADQDATPSIPVATSPRTP